MVNAAFEMVADNRTMISWPAVTGAEGREFLQGYRVDLTIIPLSSMDQKRRQTTSQSIPTLPNVTSVTIETEPLSEYTVQVFAEFDVDGVSLSSPVTAATTFGSSQEGEHIHLVYLPYGVYMQLNNISKCTHIFLTGTATSSDGSDGGPADSVIITAAVVSVVVLLLSVLVVSVVVLLCRRRYIKSRDHR